MDGMTINHIVSIDHGSHGGFHFVMGVPPVILQSSWMTMTGQQVPGRWRSPSSAPRYWRGLTPSGLMGLTVQDHVWMLL